MKNSRSYWGTKFGFYLAAIGSAFGLGNLWRFPYVVAANGGGAFVLLYTLLAFMFGLPLLIGELMLGKMTSQSTMGAIEKVLTDKKIGYAADHTGLGWRKFIFKNLGRFSVLATTLVLSYYAVISAWVLHFLMQMVFSLIKSEVFVPDSALNVLRENGMLQVLLTSVHILLIVVVVARGVQLGIERWISYLMPFFLILLLYMGYQILSLSATPDAMRYLFYPDFSKLNTNSLLYAIGQVCFTLSLGFGTMITFGSYLKPETRIPAAGFRVSLLDTVISLFAGFLIFPILLSTGQSHSGPEVLFQTLPHLFAEVNNGLIFGIAFFLCLYMASIAVSIGLLECVVSNVLDHRVLMSRQFSTWLCGFFALVFALVPALSTSLLSQYQYHGISILEILDRGLINLLLPVAAVGFCWIMAHEVRDEVKRREFINDDSEATQKLFSHWLFFTKWFALIIFIVALVLSFL